VSGGPLRVAHVVSSSEATGVESHLLTLLPSFARDEVAPVLFVARPGPLVERMASLGIPVERGAPARKLDLGSPLALARRWRGGFDLVHAHGPRAAFWARHGARLAGLPFVLTLHELRWRTLRPGLRRSWWLRLEGGSWRGAALIVTVSEAARRELVERHPELAGRTRVVHASAPMLRDPSRLPRANPARAPGEPLRLVTIGRLGWSKGYERLLEALALVRARGTELTLEVVGAGELERELRDRAARLGLGERILWLGPDVDVPAVLARAHAFVSATRSETFGIAVLEAMAVGLPVILPAVGGLPELVVDGETGVLVPAEPEAALPGALAAGLVALADDPATAARLGAAAAVRARETFSPAVMARGVTQVYREVLGERGAARPPAS
jgi:glycosyltransferase involved in cell wall biosynthesis